MDKSKYFLPAGVIIAGLLIAGAVIFFGGGLNQISSQKAGEKAMAYINSELLQDQAKAELIEINDAGFVYRIKISVQGAEYDSFITKDGKFLFPTGFELEKTSGDSPSPSPAALSVPKTAKPEAKLFVMSYCPYGLQAEKAFLPVYNLLKDKVDMGIYFVNYIMHEKQEIDENLRQYCVQKSEAIKFPAYLDCFIKEGDSQKCQTQAGIDKTKLSSCVAETDSQFSITKNYNDKDTWVKVQGEPTYPKFLVSDNLNQEFGVQGSPTFVINGVIVETDRSAEKIKEAICSSFENPPEECSQKLSEEISAPGFGLGTAQADQTNASCH